jgi:hypothetical protein
MDGIVVPSGGTRSSGAGWGTLGVRFSCTVTGIGRGLVHRFRGGARRGEHRLSPASTLPSSSRPRGSGRQPRFVPWPTYSDAGILAQPRSRSDAFTEEGSKRTRNLGWRTSPGGCVYPGTAQSAMSVGGHKVHRQRAGGQTRRARCGRRAPERRRSGRGGGGGSGGASAGPGPEHIPDAWRSRVTSPWSVWPT